MASAPRPSARTRQPWRARASASEPTSLARRVRRWLLSILFFALVALLIRLLWGILAPPVVDVAYLQVDYEWHAVPAVPFGHGDIAAFKKAGIAADDLRNRATQETMTALSQGLDRVTHPQKTLILYLSAHGVSEGDKGYLLCNNFDGNAGRVGIVALLEEVCRCQAGEKILILDTGHLSVEPQLGMPVNEFPKLLTEAVRETKDNRLWVLSSNSMHESSHVSHSARRSVFNFFVVEGLNNLAADTDGDGLDLAELVAFASSGVIDWVKANGGDGESQTPQILWGGGSADPKKLEQEMRKIHLPITTRTQGDKTVEPKENESTPESADTVPRPAKTNQAGIGQGWFADHAPVGLLPASTVALAQQSPADSSKDKKPTADATPSMPTEPDAAKKGDAERSKPESALAEGQDAVAPKSETKTEPAKETKPAADHKATETARPPEQQSPPLGDKQELSLLRRAWVKRDSLIRSDGSPALSPIDYQPHLWRKYEYDTIRYESRLRDGEAKEPPSPPDPKLQDLLDQTVSPAFRARNVAIERAVNIVAWHARSSGRNKDQGLLKPRIDIFLRELIEFEKLFEQVVDSRFSEDLNNTLEEKRKTLIEAGAQIGVENTGTDLRAIEDLLSTPLVDSERRINLLNALQGTGTRLDSQAVAAAAKRAADRPISDLLGSLQQRATELAADSYSSPWVRSIEHLRFEIQLIRLADPAIGNELNDELTKIIRTSSARNAVRSMGKRLADYYRGLPGNIRNVTPSNPSELRAAERRLRLLAVAHAKQLPDEFNPISKLKWSPLPASDFSFVGFEPSLEFVSGGPTELNGWLKVTREYHGAAVNLTLNYNDSELEILSDGNSLPTKPNKPKSLAIPSDRSIPLKYRVKYRVQARPQRKPETILKFTASALQSDTGGEATCPITFAVPPPDDIKLVVVPEGEFNESLVLDAKRRLIELATFPGHVTEFSLRLKHQLKHSRKVDVELRAVPEAEEEAIRDLLRKQEIDLKKLNSKTTPVTSTVKEGMDLPAREEAARIEFEQFPKTLEHPKESTPKPATDSKEEPKKQSIKSGLVCIITDREPNSSGPWVTFIDFWPWAPKNYVEPKVAYVEQVLTVKLSLVSNDDEDDRQKMVGRARPQDQKPITIKWDAPKEIQEKEGFKGIASLNQKNGFSDQIKAPIERNDSGILDLELDIDGYPRAFFYKVPLNGNHPHVDRAKPEAKVEIVDPKPLAFCGDTDRGKPFITLPIKVKVTTPHDAFARGSDDRVEVFLVEVDDETFNKKEGKWTASTDRQIDLKLEKITHDVVAVNTDVRDFEDKLECPRLNGPYNLVAQLLLKDGPKSGKSVAVIFDNTQPKVEHVDYKPVVFRGESALLRVTVSDVPDVNGTEAIWFAVDKIGNGKLDNAEREEAKKTETSINNGRAQLIWKPAEVGQQVLLVWAKDRVGWESEPYRVEIEVKEKSNSPSVSGAPPPARKGTIKARVTYGDNRIRDISVTLDGPVKSEEKTDDKGEVTFKDLPEGDYKFEASGTVKNSRRTGIATKKVPANPPRDAIPVEIKLK